MIRLKNKSKIMRELREDAEVAFENSSNKDGKIKAYLDGANDLLKKLSEVGELIDYPKCSAEPYEHNKSIFYLGMCQFCYRKNAL